MLLVCFFPVFPLFVCCWSVYVFSILSFIFPFFFCGLLFPNYLACNPKQLLPFAVSLKPKALILKPKPGLVFGVLCN
jgi:hypothetical protein